MHAYARTHVCTHALGTHRKILGAVCISAQEQNSGSNAISHSQFFDAILTMQFHFCRRQCNSSSPTLARLREILVAIQQKSFQKVDAISQFPEAFAVPSFKKDDAIFNSTESSWEAKARNACRGLLLQERRHITLPSCSSYQYLAISRRQIRHRHTISTNDIIR